MTGQAEKMAVTASTVARVAPLVLNLAMRFVCSVDVPPQVDRFGLALIFCEFRDDDIAVFDLTIDDLVYFIHIHDSPFL